jgi:hypothetical protein
MQARLLRKGTVKKTTKPIKRLTPQEQILKAIEDLTDTLRKIERSLYGIWANLEKSR